MSRADIHTGPVADAPGAESETVALAHTNGASRAAVVQANGAGGALNPLALIQFAIESKTPAAELKELVALAEQMSAREAAREFNAQLRAFQRACPPIKKNKTAKITTKGGGAYQFTYAELDVIEPHIKPYLDDLGFSYSFDTKVDEKGILLTCTCTLLHENGHSRSSSFTLPIANESGMSPQQKVGAANTYAKRQSLSAVLGLNITDKEAPDSETDPTTITEDQALELEDLLTETGTNREKFLTLFDTATVAQLRAANYAPAKGLLQEKLAARRRRQQ